MKKSKHKYYRITATSMTSYEYYIKVPDTITEEDIWEQRDWEYDECLEIDEDEAKENGFDEWDAEAFKK